jgi:hypothetical protein
MVDRTKGMDELVLAGRRLFSTALYQIPHRIQGVDMRR